MILRCKSHYTEVIDTNGQYIIEVKADILIHIQIKAIFLKIICNCIKYDELEFPEYIKNKYQFKDSNCM